ncbi:hypothetical protein SAMN05421788_102231 [Filimonas lacunae]|uniref:Lipoprotein n=1 Tax=Filimonas lacunae TaxID=477680 RepID=A0A173MHP9_9BACT|nr:hypothetical protein [Filimonas lacunae]BAV07142.1 hypothetical protein FLA_3165 [Filimonas lacunae]SIS94406.1 hypothetical protein SAMN05421788_102231 [Filimonas lacunae]
MKQVILTTFTAIAFAACSTPKTYFTPPVRANVEANGIDLTKIQYYVDRDVELKREVASGSTKVSAGVVKFENGKYVNIITLKKNTPGVCTKAYADKIDVSFEMGDGKHLTFGKLQRDSHAAYTLYADSWGRDLGAINYDGHQYYILPSGSEARLQIKKSVANNSKVEKREMKGRKVAG